MSRSAIKRQKNQYSEIKMEDPYKKRQKYTKDSGLLFVKKCWTKINTCMQIMFKENYEELHKLST